MKLYYNYIGMKKFKVVISDLDGTLLTDDKKIKEPSLNTINDLRNKGITFAIATGRAFCMTKSFCDQIGGEIPLILFNGGKIMFSQSQKIIKECFLKTEASRKIIDLINKEKGTFIFWQNEQVYISEDNERSREYLHFNKQPQKIYKEGSSIENISKFIWLDDVELEKKHHKMLNKIKGLNVFTSAPRFLEIVPKDVNKGKALKYLAKILNVSIKEVVALGDGDNDVSMIKVAGYGATHYKASKNAIKVADYVSNSDNNNNLICEVVKSL